MDVSPPEIPEETIGFARVNKVERPFSQILLIFLYADEANCFGVISQAKALIVSDCNTDKVEATSPASQIILPGALPINHATFLLTFDNLVSGTI